MMRDERGSGSAVGLTDAVDGTRAEFLRAAVENDDTAVVRVRRQITL